MIFKETKIRHPLYVATLDNGVTLCVYDGYAEGSDGKVYICVEQETDEGEYEVVGWRENGTK
ncbi:MAG: hypothetical protein UHM85_04655 [Acutalibacteraceae bacterium]|nr:hypothetical protein [Acutalibacteraceae bacterium]